MIIHCPSEADPSFGGKIGRCVEGSTLRFANYIYIGIDKGVGFAIIKMFIRRGPHPITGPKITSSKMGVLFLFLNKIYESYNN